jgi:tetratricopeptide (TPR) repeat protein
MLKKISFILILCTVYIFQVRAQVVHKPAELMQIMNASKITYTLAELYVDINDKDYSNLRNESNIYHEDSDGHMVVKRLILTKEAEAEWNAAEKAFKEDSNYKEARKHYKNVFDIQADYYPAKMRIAQTYEKEKDFDKAIIAYKQAISRNYVDYMPHWLLAEVYYKQKDFDGAVNEITVAHILDRNNPQIMEALVEIYIDAKLQYDDWVFTPQFKIFKGQKDNEIKVLSKPGWNGYAIAKAIWSYEPGYADGQGEKPNAPSLLQEKECMLSLLKGQDENKPNTNKGIVNLQIAQDNKMMDSFIYYEEILRKQPSMVYQLPNSVIKKISTYVLVAHAGQKP